MAAMLRGPTAPEGPRARHLRLLAQRGPLGAHAGWPQAHRASDKARGAEFKLTAAGVFHTHTNTPSRNTHDVTSGERGHRGGRRAGGQELGAGQGQGQAWAAGRLGVPARRLLPLALARPLGGLNPVVCGGKTELSRTSARGPRRALNTAQGPDNRVSNSLRFD